MSGNDDEVSGAGAGAEEGSTPDGSDPDRREDSGIGHPLAATAILPGLALQERAARAEKRRSSELRARAEEAPLDKTPHPLLFVAVGVIGLLLLVVAGLGVLLLLK